MTALNMEEYLKLVANYTALGSSLEGYERRLAEYYFANNIPAFTAAMQILDRLNARPW